MTTAASSAAPPEGWETRDWYDADAVTFATVDDPMAPGWVRAWPPEVRSLETQARSLVVAAQAKRG